MTGLMTFRQNLGLGDTIATSGAVAKLSEQFPMRVLAQEKYLESVRSIYATCPNVTVEPIGKLGWGPWIQNKAHIDALPETIPDGIDRDHYRYIYEVMLGLPYSTRWDYCPIPDSRKLVEQLPLAKVRYQLIHDDPARRFSIDPALVSDMARYSFFEVGSVLRLCDVIENAAALHFMDSSLFHLAEQLEPDGDLYLHRYAKNTYTPIWLDFETRHEWVIYGEKTTTPTGTTTLHRRTAKCLEESNPNRPFRNGKAMT